MSQFYSRSPPRLLQRYPIPTPSPKTATAPLPTRQKAINASPPHKLDSRFKKAKFARLTTKKTVTIAWLRQRQSWQCVELRCGARLALREWVTTACPINKYGHGRPFHLPWFGPCKLCRLFQCQRISLRRLGLRGLPLRHCLYQCRLLPAGSRRVRLRAKNRVPTPSLPGLSSGQVVGRPRRGILPQIVDYWRLTGERNGGFLLANFYLTPDAAVKFWT